MDANGLLLPVLTAVLHLHAATSGTPASLFFSGGQEAVLPCAGASPADRACSSVSWFYLLGRQYSPVAEYGNVVSRSASRLSLDTACSLVIQNITARDAGLFLCQQSWDANQYDTVFLNVLTISPFPPDADPKRDGEVTLACALWRRYASTCPQHSLRWADQSGAELLGAGAGHRVLGQTNCVSFLAVKRRVGLSRRYTCRFVEENRVAVEAEYTPDSTGGPTSDPVVTTDDPVDHTITITITITIITIITIIIIGVVLVVTVLIRYRKRAKVTEDVPKPSRQPDEPESHLTYVTFSHAHQQAAPYIKVKGEEVTYSTINTLVRAEADQDPSSLYSAVSKPK